MKLYVVLIACFAILLGVACKQHPAKNNDKKSTINIVDSTVVIKEIKSPYDTFAYNAYNEIACFLAGKEISSPKEFESYFKMTEWVKYSVAFSSSWQKYDTTVIKIINKWSSENLNYGDTIFYPFSGPDYNYMDALFPESKFSVLIGLEKPGSIPDIASIETDSIGKFLTNLKKSLYYNIEFSFFRTKSMKTELNSEILDGTIPIIMLFMAKHNQVLVNMNPISIDSLGNYFITEPNEEFQYDYRKVFSDGVEFVYKSQNDTALKRLIYFSIDLSNSGIQKEEYHKFLINNIKSNTVFLKAASYLCFLGSFSNIMNLILDNAKQVITDPSGIPYVKFGKQWDVDLFGEYVGPINLFQGFKQVELKEAVDSIKPKKLPFKFGYHPSHWCMIVANSKTIPK